MIKIDALRPAEKNEAKNGWSVPIIYQITLAKFENNFENNFDNNFFEKYMGHIVLLHLLHLLFLMKKEELIFPNQNLIS